MEGYPVPIHMLSLCDPEGKMRPVRFQMETADHRLETVSITQVLSTHGISYVGVEAMVYLCKAVLGNRERVFELRYGVRSHRWVLQRMVS